MTFHGAAKGESVGVLDLLAVRKNHRTPLAGTKRGDLLQILLIQEWTEVSDLDAIFR